MAYDNQQEQDWKQEKIQKNKATFEKYLKSQKAQSRFREMLHADAPGFVNALRSLYYSDEKLQLCDPGSVLQAAQYAAGLKLSPAPNLGYVSITPRSGKATFNIDYKGYIQLAHKTQQYTRIHAGAVCEGEIRGIDCVTGDVIRGEKISDEIVGYVAYMRLINGFEKACYMTIAAIEAHGKKYHDPGDYVQCRQKHPLRGPVPDLYTGWLPDSAFQKPEYGSELLHHPGRT